MLQENSFFSQPMIYFGSPHLINDDEDDDEDYFFDPWLKFTQTNLQIEQTPTIGLFIHWIDLNE